MGLFLAAVFNLEAHARPPVITLTGGPWEPGTVALLRVRVDPRPLVLRWSGLGQRGRFHDYGKSKREFAALIALPLKTKAGQHHLKVEWGEPGKLQSQVVPIQLQPDSYPSSKQPLKVKRLRSKLYRSLPKEKGHLTKAWRQADGPPLWRGPFRSPLEKEYRLSSVFGKKRVYNDGRIAWSHKGVDYAAPTGTTVVATSYSKVLLAVEGLKAYGGVVVLGHGADLATTFMHLSAVHVKEGQKLKPGDKVGEVGSEGIATGAHLHWQMTLRNHPVQPLQWLTTREFGLLR